MPAGKGYGNPLKGNKMMKKSMKMGGMKMSGRNMPKDMGMKSARDPESIRKEQMVRKGVPNHVSA